MARVIYCHPSLSDQVTIPTTAMSCDVANAAESGVVMFAQKVIAVGGEQENAKTLELVMATKAKVNNGRAVKVLVRNWPIICLVYRYYL